MARLWPRKTVVSVTFVAMLSYAAIANTLTESLRLTQPPVAVCLTDEVPPGVEMWSGHSPAGCRFWQEAATHNLDMIAESQKDLGDALKVFGNLR